MVLNLRYYKKTNIFDYLLLSIYFFCWSILQGLTFWYCGFVSRYYTHDGIVGKYKWWDLVFSDFIVYFWVSLDALPLFIIAIRAKYGSDLANIPNMVKALTFITIALTLFGWIDQADTRIYSDNPITDSLRWALIGNRTIYHSFIVYAFLTTKFEKNPRTLRSRWIWIISSSFWVISMVQVILYDYILNQPETSGSDGGLVFFFVFILAGAFLLLFNHVYYPEAVLFTHEQLNIAFSIYETIELSGNRLKDYGLSAIHDYMDSIPKELLFEKTVE